MTDNLATEPESLCITPGSLRSAAAGRVLSDTSRQPPVRRDDPALMETATTAPNASHNLATPEPRSVTGKRKSPSYDGTAVADNKRRQHGSDRARSTSSSATRNSSPPASRKTIFTYTPGSTKFAKVGASKSNGVLHSSAQLSPPSHTASTDRPSPFRNEAIRGSIGSLINLPAHSPSPTRGPAKPVDDSSDALPNPLNAQVSGRPVIPSRLKGNTSVQREPPKRQSNGTVVEVRDNDPPDTGFSIVGNVLAHDNQELRNGHRSRLDHQAPAIQADEVGVRTGPVAVHDLTAVQQEKNTSAFADTADRNNKGCDNSGVTSHITGSDLITFTFEEPTSDEAREIGLKYMRYKQLTKTLAKATQALQVDRQHMERLRGSISADEGSIEETATQIDLLQKKMTLVRSRIDASRGELSKRGGVCQTGDLKVKGWEKTLSSLRSELDM